MLGCPTLTAHSIIVCGRSHKKLAHPDVSAPLAAQAQ